VGVGVEVVLMRSEQLAKGWLLARLEEARLEEAAAILAADVARDGPRICDAVVRAICDDADLRRIEPGGALEPLVSRAGEIAGADNAEVAAHAVESLRDVVWSALRGELGHDDPEVLVDAAERLSLVAELLRAAVLRRRAEGDAPGSRPGRWVAPLRVASTEAPAAPREGPPGGEESGAPGLEEIGGTAGQGAGGEGRPTGRRAGGGGDALWIGALGEEIVSATRARSPLSLLLVELEGAEPLVAIEPRGEAATTFGRFARAVRTAVRRRDVLACETDSRAWIIARDTGRTGAQALGSRIAVAVPAEESWRGAPLTVSVGLAVLGEDGHNATALIDAAEQTRCAAQASGIGIVSAGVEERIDPRGPGPSLAG
jgi:GGDEF domain-containing protein